MRRSCPQRTGRSRSRRCPTRVGGARNPPFAPAACHTNGSFAPATCRPNGSSPPQSRRGAARGTRLPVACPRGARRGGGGRSGYPYRGRSAAGHPPGGGRWRTRDRRPACRSGHGLPGVVRPASGSARHRRCDRERGGPQCGDRLVCAGCCARRGTRTCGRRRRGGPSPGGVPPRGRVAGRRRDRCGRWIRAARGRGRRAGAQPRGTADGRRPGSRAVARRSGTRWQRAPPGPLVPPPPAATGRARS